MIKYKPWNTEVSNAWDNEEVSDEMFGEKWNSFLQTDLGQQLVPDRRRHLTNAEIYFSNESVNDDFEDTIDTNNFPRENLMYLAELSNTQVANEDKAVDEQYWYQCHQKFCEEEINSMPSWLINAKKNCRNKH